MAHALFLHLPGGGLGMSPWFLGDPGSIPHLLPFGFSGCKRGDLAFWCKPRGSKTKEEPPKVSEPVWSWEEGRRRGLRAPRQLWRDFIMEIIFFCPFLPLSRGGGCREAGDDAASHPNVPVQGCVRPLSQFWVRLRSFSLFFFGSGALSRSGSDASRGRQLCASPARGRLIQLSWESGSEFIPFSHTR